MSLIQLLPSSGNDASVRTCRRTRPNAVTTVRTTGDSLSPGSGLGVFACYHIVVLLAGAAVLLKQRDA